MALEIPKEAWAGTVREVTLGATADQGGTRSRTLKVGAENTLPFLHFEGNIPNPPVLALEIRDRKPDDWSPLLSEAWGDVMDDPAAWAKAAEDAGADMIYLVLSPTISDDSPNTAENSQTKNARRLSNSMKK